MAGSITDCMLCAILQVFARTFEQPKDTKAVEVECAHILPSSFGKFKEGEGFIISRMWETVSITSRAWPKNQLLNGA